MTTFSMDEVSSRSRSISVERDDGVAVDIDVGVIGMSDSTLTVSVYPMKGLNALDLTKIEFDHNGSMHLKFDLGEDKRNG